MQIDFEARSKVSAQYFFRFLIKALASGQTARKRADHLLRINACFCSEDQRLTYRRKIDGYDDLIRQFCEPTRSQRTHMRNRLTQRIENRESSFEVMWLGPCHDRKRSLDRSFFAAADRSIDHRDADRREILRNLLRRSEERRVGKRVERGGRGKSNKQH